MGKQITVRNVGPELSRRLGRLAEARRTSVNAAILQVLEEAVGLDEGTRRTRLSRYTTWSEDDLQEFLGALAAQREVDPKIWA